MHTITLSELYNQWWNLKWCNYLLLHVYSGLKSALANLITILVISFSCGLIMGLHFSFGSDFWQMRSYKMYFEVYIISVNGRFWYMSHLFFTFFTKILYFQLFTLSSSFFYFTCSSLLVETSLKYKTCYYNMFLQHAITTSYYSRLLQRVFALHSKEIFWAFFLFNSNFVFLRKL